MPFQKSASIQNMDKRCQYAAFELQGVTGNFKVYPIVPKRLEKCVSSGVERQRDFCSVCEQVRRYQQMYVRINDNYFCHNTGAGNNLKCKIFGGKIEFVCRQIVKDPVSIRMAAASKDVSSIGPDVGATYSGPFCLGNDLSGAKIQFSVSGSKHGGSGCPQSRMEGRKQFCKSALLDVRKSDQQSDSGWHRGNNHCAEMACTDLVFKVKKVECGSTNKITKFSQNNAAQNWNSRTFEKQVLDDISLESVWTKKLIHQKWSKIAIEKFLHAWSQSMWYSYNKHFKNFVQYLTKNDISLAAISPQVIVDYMVYVADGSNRPKAVLTSASAALSMYFKAMDTVELVNNKDLVYLMDGLIKSGMIEPMKRMKVMPVQPFLQMFRSWGENAMLSVWSLRLKAITLLALTVMLQPSDIAPRSVGMQSRLLSQNLFR